MNGISVIIPVFNEIESVSDTISSVKKVLDGMAGPNEIIIVDDGSTDGTQDVLNGLKSDKGLRVLRHRHNKGYGAALKTGIKNAESGFIFITDCDGTYPLERLPEMSRLLINGECDMIVGARIGKDAYIPLVRRPAKWCIQALANYLTGEKITDLNSGFRGVKKDILLRFMNMLPDGFSFTTTITVAMLTNDYNVSYLNISYNKRKGRSKIHPIRDTANFIQLVIKTVLYFDPLKIFLPLSVLLFASGLGVFLYTYFFAERVLDDTTVVILLAAFQIFAIGLIADLIVRRMRL